MKRKVFAKLIVISLLLIIFKYFLDSSSLFQYDDIVLDTTGHMDLDAEFWLKKNNHSRETNNETNNLVTLIDLRTRLRPKSLYKRIECRKSLMHVVRTTLCVHDIEKDIHVSGSIWSNGIWEEHILRPFVNYINQNPDWLVIDIGAQIGQYSLFAAQMGLRVLTVEPFYDNILRLHKAAHIERIEDKITLVQNALSNKRGETKLLQPSNNNIGGQGLLDNQYKTYRKDLKNKYLVETILFDDLIPVLPRTNENEMYKKAILKIDIEGFEPYAFQHASKIFDTIDIQVIFMEWGTLIKTPSLHNYIVSMVEFLVERNYSAYGNGYQYLEPIKWGSWSSWDIVWKKNTIS